MRVFLSNPNLECAAEFLAAATASEQLHRPWVFAPSTPEQFQSYLDRIRIRRTIGFLVRRASDEVLTGVVNVSEPVMGAFRSAYLGFYAFASKQRQGYMAEGLALVLEHAFYEMGFHRLEANIQPGNVASSTLVSRLGFRKEGFSPKYLMVDGAWRDHDRWAILGEEWSAHRERVFASLRAYKRQSEDA